MRNVLSVTAIALLLLVSGCSLLDGSSSGTEEAAVPITEAELVSQDGATLELSLTGEWRNTCGTFSRAEVAPDPDGMAWSTYKVVLYGKAPKDAICGQAFTPFTGTVEVTVPASALYTFVFEGPEDPMEVDVRFDDDIRQP